MASSASPFAVGVSTGDGRLLKTISTKDVSSFLPEEFVQEFVEADRLSHEQRQNCIDVVKRAFDTNEELAGFLRKSICDATRKVVDKSAATATQFKNLGNTALQRGDLLLAWDQYCTALRFAPEDELDADQSSNDRLRAVIFHNRSLALMQYAKKVVALSTSGSIGMSSASEQALLRVLMGVLLDATESAVADPTYVKAWHRFHSAVETMQARLDITAKRTASREVGGSSKEALNLNGQLKVPELFDSILAKVSADDAKSMAENLQADAGGFQTAAKELAAVLEDALCHFSPQGHHSNAGAESAQQLLFEVGKNEARGRHLTASRDLKAGTIVLADVPFASVRFAGRLRPAPEHQIADLLGVQHERCDWCLGMSHAPVPHKRLASHIFCSRACRQYAEARQSLHQSLDKASVLLQQASCVALRTASQLYPSLLSSSSTESASEAQEITGTLKPRLVAVGDQLPKTFHDHFNGAVDQIMVDEVYLMLLGPHSFGAVIVSHRNIAITRHVLELSFVLPDSLLHYTGSSSTARVVFGSEQYFISLGLEGDVTMDTVLDSGDIVCSARPNSFLSELGSVLQLLQSESQPTDEMDVSQCKDVLPAMLLTICCAHLFPSEDGTRDALGSRVQCRLRHQQPLHGEENVGSDKSVAPQYSFVARILETCGFQKEGRYRGSLITLHDLLVREAESDVAVEDEDVFGLLRADAVTAMASTKGRDKIEIVSMHSASSDLSGIQDVSHPLVAGSNVVEDLVHNLEKLPGILFLDRVVQGNLLHWMTVACCDVPVSKQPSLIVRVVMW